MGDTEGEAETIRRQCYPCIITSTPILPPQTHLLFLLFALPLIFSLYYSSSLFQFLSLVFISLFLSFSVVQILRQMSHEIFPIKTQRECDACVSKCVCGWQALHMHVCVCVFILTLALEAAGSTSRSGR